MTPAENLPQLRALVDLGEKYARELYALLDSVGAIDVPPAGGVSHRINIGPPGKLKCIFRGHLNISREKILPKRKNAYEIALEATIQESLGEERARGRTGQNLFALEWLA